SRLTRLVAVSSSAGLSSPFLSSPFLSSPFLSPPFLSSAFLRGASSVSDESAPRAGCTWAIATKRDAIATRYGRGGGEGLRGLAVSCIRSPPRRESRLPLVNGEDMRSRRSLEVRRGHHRVRELAALVRRDVRAPGARECNESRHPAGNPTEAHGYRFLRPSRRR